MVKKRRAIITSALPYANGEIHLGHVASTYLPADVTTRFLKMCNTDAYYVCASDDYGTPILIQSEKEGKTPQEYVAHWNKRDLDDFEAFGIHFDIFSQTSSDENIQFVQYVFEKLNASGHIYEKEIVQSYCENDSKFLPDRYVHGECPHCGAQDQYSDLCEACGRIPDEIRNPRCSLCGRTPVKRRSTHYFFRLGNFAEQLSDWLNKNDNLQTDVKKYVQNWIRSGLVDWDITRDISWGVPVPVSLTGTQNKKVFYGWFDNHLAYISSTLKLLEEKGLDGKEFWNSADIYHFIGKDIAYHHYLFLPAMRLGLKSEFKLPDYIPTRGHLTLQSKKISKSRNWYIGLRQFLQYYPADYLRYYLISINPYSQDDLNFDWDDFATRINSELIGNLGNLVNRVLGFTKKASKAILEFDTFDDADREAQLQIENIATHVGTLIEQNHLDRALKRIMDFSSYFNQYFQHKEPWKNDAVDSNAVCMYLSCNAIRSIAVLLHPFLPDSARRIWKQLQMDADLCDLTWNDTSVMGVQPGHVLGDISPLFTRVESADIEVHKKQLGVHS